MCCVSVVPVKLRSGAGCGVCGSAWQPVQAAVLSPWLLSSFPMCNTQRPQVQHQAKKCLTKYYVGGNAVVSRDMICFINTIRR